MMRWRTLTQYALMWGIRYTPLPWRWKQTAIWLATARFVAAGFALIPDESGRILMLRARYSGHWIPPGGALLPGEEPAEGVRRECREELGQEVELGAPIGVYTVEGTRELFFAYRADPLARPPRLSAEHERYRYMPVDQLPWFVRVMAGDAARTAEAGPVVRRIGWGG